MNDCAFALQLGVVLVVILAIAVSTIGFAFRSIRAGVEPCIKASFRKLQSGWFQLHVSIANQAPYPLVVDELKRIKPRAARLMAPIKQVSTRKGEFQVWSHPTTDKATASIPLELHLGPHEARAGAVARTSQQPNNRLAIPARGLKPAGCDPRADRARSRQRAQTLLRHRQARRQALKR